MLLKRDLKNMYLAMAAIEKLRARQRSRLKYLKAGDASSKIFFLSANGRRKKNYIQALQTQQGFLHTQEEKEGAILQYFSSVLGKQAVRNQTLN